VIADGGIDVSLPLRLKGPLTPSAGTGEGFGILFPPDPAGGTLDRAWMRYFARSGESMTLEIGTANDGDDHINLNPSGLVGIATYSPREKLEVNGNVRTLGLRVGMDGDLTATNTLNMVKFGSTGDYQILHKAQGAWGKPTLGYHCQNNHAIGFYTTGWTPLLEMDGASGNLFYRGQLSKLDVAPGGTGTVRVSDFCIGGAGGRRPSPGRALVDSTDTLVINWGADWAKVVIGGATTIQNLVSPSSAALKQDIEPISSVDAAAIVAKLDPVSFAWKADSSEKQLGFIAEDCPDAVTTAGHDGIYVSHIVAALTRVVRDQGATIDALRRRLDALTEPAG
jgi:hypothetical protein